LDRALLRRLDDPPAGEGLLRLRERAVGRDRNAVLEPDGLRLARIDEPLAVDVLAGVVELLVDLAHERDHVADPLRGPGLEHPLLVSEHHDDVLHRSIPFPRPRRRFTPWSEQPRRSRHPPDEKPT